MGKMVDLVCKDCGAVFQLTYGHYITLPKDYHFRCKKCRYKKLSNDIKRMHLNMSEEDKLERSNSLKNRRENMSFEEKQKLHNNISNGRKKYWKSLSPEERQKQIDRISKYAIGSEYWLSKDNSELNGYKKKAVESIKTHWTNLKNNDKKSYDII